VRPALAGLGSSFSVAEDLRPCGFAQGRLWAAFFRRFAAGVVERQRCGTTEVVPFPFRGRGEIGIAGGGNGKVNVDERRCGRLWFPPFAKDAKDGAPLFDLGTSQIKVNGNVKGKRARRPLYTLDNTQSTLLL